MKKNLINLFIIGALCIRPAFAQKTDSITMEKVKHVRKTLSVNAQTASNVVTVLDNYKNKVKLVADDQSLTEDNKRLKINNLIHEKVIALKKLLNAQQLTKVLPTSEIGN